MKWDIIQSNFYIKLKKFKYKDLIKEASKSENQTEEEFLYDLVIENYKKRNLSYKNKTRNSLLDESFDLAIKYINEATISCGFDKFNVFFD